MNITCSCRYISLLMNILCYQKYLALSLPPNFAFGIMLFELFSLDFSLFSLLWFIDSEYNVSKGFKFTQGAEVSRCNLIGKFLFYCEVLFIWPGLSSRSNERLAAPFLCPNLWLSLWVFQPAGQFLCIIGEVFKLISTIIFSKYAILLLLYMLATWILIMPLHFNFLTALPHLTLLSTLNCTLLCWAATGLVEFLVPANPAASAMFSLVWWWCCVLHLLGYTASLLVVQFEFNSFS